MAASATSATSAFASLSKRLLSRPFTPSLLYLLHTPTASARFFSSTIFSSNDSDANHDESAPESDEPASPSFASGETASDETYQRRVPFQRPLENGLDQGVYKAILVGKVGQQPVQKHLKSGHTVALFSIGTGGIRNNRRPLDNEEPRDYAERCAVQWHRVSVYPNRLSSLALKHVKPGSILYLEGTLETKVFTDPLTGLVRRIREIAIRRDGRLVFLEGESKGAESEQGSLKNVGYY